MPPVPKGVTFKQIGHLSPDELIAFAKAHPVAKSTDDDAVEMIRYALAAPSHPGDISHRVVALKDGEIVGALKADGDPDFVGISHVGSIHPGVGTELIKGVRKSFPDGHITLDSSDRGVPFYKSLGMEQHRLDPEDVAPGESGLTSMFSMAPWKDWARSLPPVAGLSALGAAALPREASAMADLPSPQAAMANPRLAGEHPEERAARVAAERVGPNEDWRSRYNDAWRNRYNDDRPYSLADLVHRDEGMRKFGDFADFVVENANPLLWSMNPYAQAAGMVMMSSPANAGEDEALKEAMTRPDFDILTYRSPREPERDPTTDIPRGYELNLPDMPVAVDTQAPRGLVQGGYRVPHMASGGKVSDAIMAFFKKGAAKAADEPDLGRRGFLGLNRAEVARLPEATENYSGLVPGGAASELANNLNPEMSRRGFMSTAGAAAVSTAFPQNSRLVHELSTLVEPAAAVNPNAAWAKAFTGFVKDPGLVEDSIGYLGQGGKISDFMENGVVKTVPPYMKDTMAYIAKQPKAIQADLAKSIDSYFDSINTLNNAEWSMGHSLDALVDRHPANAATRQQIMNQVAAERDQLLAKLPVQRDRTVIASPEYKALAEFDDSVARRISEAGQIPSSYADLLEPGQHYTQADLANIIDSHAGGVYNPGRGQDPLTASQWFDKHRNIAISERAQRAQEAAEVDPRTGMPSDLMYDNVSGDSRFAQGGLVYHRVPHMASGGKVSDALAKLFKKGVAVADEPDLSRRGFMGLGDLKEAPTTNLPAVVQRNAPAVSANLPAVVSEGYSGLVPGGAIADAQSALASKLNPEIDRRTFLQGVRGAVAAARYLNNPIAHGLTSLSESPVAKVVQQAPLASLTPEAAASAYADTLRRFAHPPRHWPDAEAARQYTAHNSLLNNVDNDKFMAGLAKQTARRLGVSPAELEGVLPTAELRNVIYTAADTRGLHEGNDFAFSEEPEWVQNLLNPRYEGKLGKLSQEHRDALHEAVDPEYGYLQRKADDRLADEAPEEFWEGLDGGEDGYAQGGLVGDDSPSDASFNYVETDPHRPMEGYSPQGLPLDGGSSAQLANYVPIDPHRPMEGYSAYGIPLDALASQSPMMSGRPDLGGWDPTTAQYMYFPRSYFTQGQEAKAPSAPVTAPTGPTTAPAWNQGVTADATYYPAGALGANSPAGYFTQGSHQWYNGSSAPSGYTTWSPPPPPPAPEDAPPQAWPMPV